MKSAGVKQGTVPGFHKTSHQACFWQKKSKHAKNTVKLHPGRQEYQEDESRCPFMPECVGFRNHISFTD